MPNLSVIIPSRNAENLEACVWGKLDNEDNMRLVVVDDGLERLPENCYGSTVIPGIKPFIYSRNCNLGIQASGRDDVILLNDDAILRTVGGFTAMQQVAEENPQYGLIGATSNCIGNHHQWQQSGNSLREEQRMVCFVCVFIPRRTLDIVGLLDERFVGYGCDDDDYCLRAQKAGLKIGIFDGCYVDHASLTSTYRGGSLQGGNYQSNLKLYRAKWGNLEANRVGRF